MIKRISVFIALLIFIVTQVLFVAPVSADSLLGNSVFFYAEAGKYEKAGTVYSLNNKPVFYNSVVYLPAAEAGSILGASVSTSGKSVTINSTVFNADSNIITEGETQTKTDYVPFLRNTVVYVYAADIAKACDLPCSIDSTGAVVIGDGADEISWDGIWDYYAEGTLIENPQKAEILDKIEAVLLNVPAGNDIISSASGSQHPRIIADGETFDKIRELYKTDEVVKDACDVVIKQAKSWTSLNTRPLATYGLTDGSRMLSSIYDCGNTVIASAFSYRVTGQEQYAERAWKEIENFCDDTAWPDWNPYHTMDIGEAMYNCAIAYDWLYDWLSDDQKTIIREAVVDKAWRHYWNDINGLTYTGTSNGRPNTPYESPEEELLRSSMWREYTRDNNWSLIIYGGAIMTALAMCDEMPQESAEIIENALENVTGAIEGYAPDGAWFEGPSYWEYASEFLVSMLSSLENSCGTDYGYGDMPGLRSTGRYIFALSGSDGIFNFSDTPSNAGISSDTFWYANRYNSDEVYYQAYNHYLGKNVPIGYRTETSVTSENAGSVSRAVIWYTNSKAHKEVLPETDIYFRDLETVTLRSGYDNNANFIGIHGGKNDDPHSHVDSGTFVLDYDGTRFAMDLGSDNYNILGGNYRYRYNAQGHNVMVFDPKNDKNDGNSDNFSGGQTRWNNAKIIDFKSGEDSSYAVCDLTDTYPNVSSYKRGIKLADGKRKFIIRDEFTLTSPASDAYWFMHTDAKIYIPYGGKVARLTKDGKTVYFNILSGNGTFSVLDPVGLPGTVVEDYDGQDGAYSNEGIKKLTIHMKNLSAGNQTVSIGVSDILGYSFTDSEISKWAVSESSEKPYLTGIKINGNDIPDFSRYKMEYSYTADTVPQITATGTGTVSIVKPETMNSKAFVFVSNETDTVVYTINLCSQGVSPEGTNKGFVPNGLEKSFDDDFQTSVAFSAGGAMYDLGHITKISGIAADIQSSSDVKISVSEDGENFYSIYTGKSQNGYMLYNEEELDIRYIKVTSSNYIKISEIGVINCEEKQDYEFLIAKYDKSGRMIDVGKHTFTTSPGQKHKISIDVGEGDSYVKVFMWDVTNLTPLQPDVRADK